MTFKYLQLFFVLSLVPVLFFQACGFIGQNGVFEQSSLRESLDNSSHLADRTKGDSFYSQDCEESSRCESTCEKMYESRNSRLNCYDLSVGEVADVEDVFEILKDSHPEDLKNIDSTALEIFLENGTDGFTDLIENNLSNNKIENILDWLADTEKTAAAFDKEDSNNEVLKTLMLKNCGNNCSMDGANPITVSGTQILAGSKDIARINTTDLNLFKALAQDNTGNNPQKNFFMASLNNKEAFYLGHEILEDICRAANSGRRIDNCIRAFYCSIDHSILSSASALAVFIKADNNIDVETQEQSGRTRLRCSF